MPTFGSRGTLVAGVVALLVLITGCSGGGGTGASGSGAGVNAGGVAPFTVQASDLGIHSWSTKPQVPAGSLRMSCAPSWAETEPARGTFEWGHFDRLLARAEAWGFKDILFVFCGTPAWAGRDVPQPKVEVQGPRSTSPPTYLDDWSAYVSAVAQRYKGRITGYEVWNEATSPQFYQGSMDTMADMTQRAYTAIKAADPAATVTTASIQTHIPKSLNTLGKDYLAALGARQWPVDVFNAHGYPAGTTGLQGRRAQLDAFKNLLRETGAPAKPLWDTEDNYEVSLPGGEPDGRIVGDQAAAWTAVSYLDGWRQGYQRTYWYLWSDAYVGFVGIQMRAGDPATAALSTLGDWTIGTRYQGCDEAGGLVTCHFQGTGAAGKPADFDIVYALGDSAQATVAGERNACPLYGSPCRKVSGQLAVTSMPVRLSAA